MSLLREWPHELPPVGPGAGSAGISSGLSLFSGIAQLGHTLTLAQ